METCRSPLEVLRRAHEFGSRVWTDHVSLFSRKDFTRPQLFACLVLREWLKLSYRKTEAFLTDVPAWLSELGMTHAPDHNTLWRAFGSMFTAGDMRKVLDLMAEDARVGLKTGLRAKPLTMDSTCYEPRHRSAHYDRVCRKIDLKAGTKYAERPGKHGPAVNRSRSRRVKAMPKLAIAVSAANHQILATRVSFGGGSDSPDFEPLLFDAWRRADVRTVVADARPAGPGGLSDTTRRTTTASPAWTWASAP